MLNKYYYLRITPTTNLKIVQLFIDFCNSNSVSFYELYEHYHPSAFDLYNDIVKYLFSDPDLNDTLCILPKLRHNSEYLDRWKVEYIIKRAERENKDCINFETLIHYKLISIF